MKMISKSFTIAEVLAARDTFVIPDWQRDEVWDVPRRRGLIDSILRGYRLPKFYLAHNEAKQFEVVDGQQRLATIRAFVDGAFSLSTLTMQEFGLPAGKFQDLPPALAQAIKDFTIEVDEITEATEREKREFFERLQEGVPLASREKLNAVHSGFRDYAHSLTERRFFQALVSFNDIRHAFFDVTSKVLAIAVNGLTTSFRFKDMLALFERQSGFSPTSAVAQNLTETFDFCERAFSPMTAALRDRSFVQSVITLASHLVAGGQSKGQDAAFAKFVINFHDERIKHSKLNAGNADPDYLLFNTCADRGRVIGAVRTRHEILLKKMAIMARELRDKFPPHSGEGYWVANDPADKTPALVATAQCVVMETQSFTLDEAFAQRERFTIPNWQRSEVWSKARQQLLLDSILEGWKLPKLFFSKAGDKFQVIDGQQRLTAIFHFMMGKLQLSPETVKKFKLPGGRYNDLPMDVAFAFGGFALECDVISNATIPQLKDIFQRLQYGMPLLGREKLNAVTSNLRDFSVSLSRHEFFRTRLFLGNSRHIFFNIAATVAATEVAGIDTQWKYGNLRELFEKHRDFPVDSVAAQNLNSAFDFLLRAFPERTPIRDGFFVQSIITLATRLVKNGNSSGHEAAFAQFTTGFYKAWRHSKKCAIANPTSIHFYFGKRAYGTVQGVDKWSQEVLLLAMQQTHPKMAAAFGNLPPPTLPQNALTKIVALTAGGVVTQRNAEPQNNGQSYSNGAGNAAKVKPVVKSSKASPAAPSATTDTRPDPYAVMRQVWAKLGGNNY